MRRMAFSSVISRPCSSTNIRFSSPASIGLPSSSTKSTSGTFRDRCDSPGRYCDSELAMDRDLWSSSCMLRDAASQSLKSKSKRSGIELGIHWFGLYVNDEQICFQFSLNMILKLWVFSNMRFFSNNFFQNKVQNRISRKFHG